MPDCDNKIPCCADSTFDYSSGSSLNPDVDPQPDDTDDIIAELSGLRWEIPCGATGCGMCGSNCCQVVDPADDVTELSGSDIEYLVTLRFRGVIEPKDYIGGTNDGFYFQTGGTPAVSGGNVYALVISDPPQTYYLNRYWVGSPATIAGVDYTAVVPINGGATVTLHAETIDACQRKNSGIYVPGVEPYPLAYNGQFLQMDVVSIIEA